MMDGIFYQDEYITIMESDIDALYEEDDMEIIVPTYEEIMGA